MPQQDTTRCCPQQFELVEIQKLYITTYIHSLKESVHINVLYIKQAHN